MGRILSMPIRGRDERRAEAVARPLERPSLREILASPKMLVIMVLAAASGYPEPAHRKCAAGLAEGLPRHQYDIGLMSYVSLPYLLKFLWAPLRGSLSAAVSRPAPRLDPAHPTRCWPRDCLLAVQNPAVALTSGCRLCRGHRVFVGHPGHRHRCLSHGCVIARERGLAATATNLGYRTAAWFASAVALIIADYFGWRPAFLILAGVMMLFCIATWLAPEPPTLQQPPRSLRETIVDSAARSCWPDPDAAALLRVVLLFKIGDAFANKLFTPFMLDTGFSKTEIAVIVKALFTAGALLGRSAGRRADGAARACCARC